MTILEREEREKRLQKALLSIRQSVIVAHDKKASARWMHGEIVVLYSGAIGFKAVRAGLCMGVLAYGRKGLRAPGYWCNRACKIPAVKES